jgi:SOS-response transcriptional repressor LexA
MNEQISTEKVRSPGRPVIFTSRKQDVLVAYYKYHKVHGYAPTYREVQDELGFASTATVKHCVEYLHQKGLVSATPKISRGVVLTSMGKEKAQELIGLKNDSIRHEDEIALAN